MAPITAKLSTHRFTNCPASPVVPPLSASCSFISDVFLPLVSFFNSAMVAGVDVCEHPGTAALTESTIRKLLRYFLATTPFSQRCIAKTIVCYTYGVCADLWQPDRGSCIVALSSYECKAYLRTECNRLQCDGGFEVWAASLDRGSGLMHEADQH